MNDVISGLRHLHALHLQLHSVREKRNRGPKQINAHNRLVSKKEAELAGLKEQLKSLKVTAAQKSTQHTTNESKIADLTTKLNVASSNREFDIIKSQIDADKMANSVLEDEILEVLEKIDQLELTIKQAEDECDQARKDAERVDQQVAELEPELSREMETVERELSSAETVIPEPLRETYRRLVHAHGANALAPVDNKACSACYQIVSPQLLVDLNVGQIVFCRSCGRILFKTEEE